MSEIFEVSDKWVVSEEWVRDSTSAVGGPVITLNIETFSHDPDPSRTGRSVKVRSLDDGSGSDLVRPGS